MVSQCYMYYILSITIHKKDQGQEDHISILIHVNEDILQTHYVMPAPE